MICSKSQYVFCNCTGGMRPGKDIDRSFNPHRCRIDRKTGQKSNGIINGKNRNQFYPGKTNNERLLSFTLHQGTKTPGFDPVNVTNQLERMRCGIFLTV